MAACFHFLAMGDMLHYEWIIIVCLTTFSLYNLQHQFEQINITAARSLLNKSNWILLMPLLLWLALLVHSNKGAFWLASCLSLSITAIYFFSPGKYIPAWRNHPILKPIAIGLVFGLMTAGIPSILIDCSFKEIALITLGQSMNIAALSIIYDIKDIKEDISSFVLKYGIQKTISATILLLMCSGIIYIMSANVFLLTIHGVVSYCLSITICIWLVFQKRWWHQWWYHFVLIDGIIGLPLLFYLILFNM